MFVALAIAFVAALITIFTIFYGIKDCDVEYGAIVEWGYQHPQEPIEQDSLSPFSYRQKVDDPRKFITYYANGSVTTLNINQSGDLEIIKEIYPVEGEYIITVCDGELEGFSRRGFVNDIFFYKLAKLI
jgi:hypothetical protein